MRFSKSELPGDVTNRLFKGLAPIAHPISKQQLRRLQGCLQNTEHIIVFTGHRMFRDVTVFHAVSSIASITTLEFEIVRRVLPSSNFRDTLFYLRGFQLVLSQGPPF